MEQKLTDDQKIKSILNNNPVFYLISTSLIYDGARKFIDIPIISIADSFPERVAIFHYAMDYLGVDDMDIRQSVVESFSVVNIHEFKNIKQYEAFTGQQVNPNGISHE